MEIVKPIVLFALLLLNGIALRGQFHPAAGKPGSNAIQKDDAAFIGWANSCQIKRGLIDAADSSSDYASFGDETAAVGPANGAVVSLGDAGEAVLYFEIPIANGPGYDFAVFENAFNDTYLELAFVEVSTDGIHFVRFPATSLTDTVLQVSSFGNLNPEKINNFAGKYRVFWGTPFDLQELVDSPLLDLSKIHYVKLVDVIGTIHPDFCSYDAYGNKVNDPYPTSFESGGFDLDAVGVINNQQSLAFLNTHFNTNPIILFPNPAPANAEITVSVSNPVELYIYNMNGQQVFSLHNVNSSFQLPKMKPGTFILKWKDPLNQKHGIVKFNVYE